MVLIYIFIIFLKHSRINCYRSDNTPIRWTKVFSHDTSGGMFKNDEETLSKNEDNPDAKLFSILDVLESMRLKDETFHLKICYPEIARKYANRPCNEWIQESNPATESEIRGYREIHKAFLNDPDDFQGLGLNSGKYKNSLIDSTPHKANWLYAIGAQKASKH